MKIIKNRKYRILNNVSKYGIIFVLVFSIMMPFVLGGHNVNANTDSQGSSINIQTKIENPLGESGPSNIPDFIKTILNIVLIVGVPVVAVYIIYTGFLFVKAQGNSTELTNAKKALFNTLIGAVLLLGAYVIAESIQGTVEEIKRGV